MKETFSEGENMETNRFLKYIKEKTEKENQLLAPFAVCPKKNNKINNKEKTLKRVTKTSVLFKNLKSINEKVKRKENEIPSQIS